MWGEVRCIAELKNMNKDEDRNFLTLLSAGAKISLHYLDKMSEIFIHRLLSVKLIQAVVMTVKEESLNIQLFII